MEELVGVHDQNSMKVQSAHPLMQVPHAAVRSKATRLLSAKVLFGFSTKS